MKPSRSGVLTIIVLLIVVAVVLHSLHKTTTAPDSPEYPMVKPDAAISTNTPDSAPAPIANSTNLTPEHKGGAH